MIVIGIENLHDGFCQILLFHCLLIIAPVKGIQLEGSDGLRIPDAQGIDHIVSVTDHRQVIGDCPDGLIPLLDEIVPSIPALSTDISAEFDLHGILGAADFKGVAVLQPVIRHLHLVSVLNLLLEHSVAVADAAAVGRIAQGRQRIQETCCQPSQAAVSKSRIRLLVLNYI